MLTTKSSRLLLGVSLTILLAPVVAFAQQLPPSPTVALYNTANDALNDSVYGADFVDGDTWVLAIQGAAHNKPVTMTAWQNGVPLNGGNPWTAGQTLADGSFSTGGKQTSNYIANYVEKWFVDGVQVGQDLDFDVIPVPTSLSVASAVLAARPDGCVASGATYYIAIDVKYNILTSAGVNLATTVPIIPWESGIFYKDGGVFWANFQGDIGGPSSQYPNSHLYAADDGTFHDVPIGTCAAAPFSNGGALQTIYSQIGNALYRVRLAQRWTTSSASPANGSITNSIDVSLTR